MHMVTCLWRRLIVPYIAYPWCLAPLTDPRLDQEEKLEIAVRFVGAQRCCLDSGFAARLRSQVAEPEDILEGGRMHPALQLLSHHKVLNSEIENNFARCASAAKNARGWFGFFFSSWYTDMATW